MRGGLTKISYISRNFISLDQHVPLHLDVLQSRRDLIASWAVRPLCTLSPAGSLLIIHLVVQVYTYGVYHGRDGQQGVGPVSIHAHKGYTAVGFGHGKDLADGHLKG